MLGIWLLVTESTGLLGWVLTASGGRGRGRRREGRGGESCTRPRRQSGRGDRRIGWIAGGWARGTGAGQLGGLGGSAVRIGFAFGCPCFGSFTGVSFPCFARVFLWSWIHLDGDGSVAGAAAAWFVGVAGSHGFPVTVWTHSTQETRPVGGGMARIRTTVAADP